MDCSPSTSHIWGYPSATIHWDKPPKMGTQYAGIGSTWGACIYTFIQHASAVTRLTRFFQGQTWYPSTDPGRALKYWGLTWNIERQGQILLSLGLLFGNPPWIHLLGSVPDLFQGQKWWAPENYCFDGNEPLGSYRLHQTIWGSRDVVASQKVQGEGRAVWHRAPFWGIPEMVSWWIWFATLW